MTTLPKEYLKVYQNEAEDEFMRFAKKKKISHGRESAKALCDTIEQIWEYYFNRYGSVDEVAFKASVKQTVELAKAASVKFSRRAS